MGSHRCRVKVCSKVGPAIGTYDFSIKLDGGGSGVVKFPSSNYVNNFESLRLGCARGWIVFELPKAKPPSQISFEFDDTGDSSSVGNPGGSRQETHERFSWTLG